MNYGSVATIVTTPVCSLPEELVVGNVNLKLKSRVVLWATLVSKGNSVLADENVIQLVPSLENSHFTWSAPFVAPKDQTFEPSEKLPDLIVRSAGPVVTSTV